MDKIRRFSPVTWLFCFAAAAPWIRVELGDFTLYPGHLLLSGLLLLGMAAGGGMRGGGAGGPPGGVSGGRRGARLPLKTALLLGIYLAVMAGVRQQWDFLALFGASLVLNYGWGWAAYQFGRSSGGAGAAGDGLILLLAATLPAGLAGWGAAYLWPPLCRVVNCPRPFLPPYVFQGGWAGPEQYFLFIVLLLPAAGAFLILLNRNRRHRGARNLLAVILAGCGAGLLAGASLWVLLLLAGAFLGALARLRRSALPGDARLFKGAAAAIGLGALVIYGLFPAYLSIAVRGASPDGPGGHSAGVLRIEYVEPPPAGLSSERETEIRLRLTNAGVVRLGDGADGHLRLRARLLITPKRGRTRAYSAAGRDIVGALAPGRSLTMTLPVRLPHWARDGYLAWRVEDPGGPDPRLAADSALGFRFVNKNYRALESETGNQLSALAARARDFAAHSFLPEGRERNTHSPQILIGEMLDTLFFSPLWGLEAAAGAKPQPFAAPRPFWVQLFQEYGAIGLVLAGAFALAIVRRSLKIAARFIRSGERIGWQLVPLSGVLLVLIGIFSPVLGSFHGVWGLFLLSGYIEGKYDHWFAQPPPLRAKPAFWPWRRQGRRNRLYKPLKKRRIHR